MTFTKEQLQQIIETDHVQCGDASALARIALASLEAEPVAMRWRYLPDGIQGMGEWNYRNQAYIDPLNAHHLSRQKELLFTAPPAPVVPDEIQKLKDGRGFKYVKDGVHYSANYANGWNQCRAAMLQGAAGNSPAIPDGYALVPVELTGAMTNALTEAILDDLHNVDVWRSVLAAAPQHRTMISRS